MNIDAFTRHPVRLLALAVLTASLAACGRPKEDALRTVKSYDFASCDSTPTTDPVQLAAIEEFKRWVQTEYFTRRSGSLYAANHESALESSGLREYEGPFYIYVHPRPPNQYEAAKGIDWSATVYLHAAKVRSRLNGGKWGEWQSVRTRNFTQAGQTVDRLGRWKCLIGAEIAWADVHRHGGEWQVQPLAVGVYGADELSRALPVPGDAEIRGSSPVEAQKEVVRDAGR